MFFSQLTRDEASIGNRRGLASERDFEFDLLGDVEQGPYLGLELCHALRTWLHLDPVNFIPKSHYHDRLGGPNRVRTRQRPLPIGKLVFAEAAEALLPANMMALRKKLVGE